MRIERNLLAIAAIGILSASLDREVCAVENSVPVNTSESAVEKASQTKQLQSPNMIQIEGMIYDVTSSKSDVGSGLILAGRKQLHRGELLPAYRTLKEAVQVEGTSPFDRVHVQALAFFSIAECYIKENNLAVAADLIDRGTQLLAGDRREWKSKFVLSQLHSAEGRRHAAIEDLKQALALALSRPSKDQSAAFCREQLAKLYADDRDFTLASNTVLENSTRGPKTESGFTARTASAYYLAEGGQNGESEKASDSLCADILNHQSERVRNRALPKAARNRAIVLRRLGNESAATMWEQKADEADAQRKKNGEGKQPDFITWMPAMQQKIRGNWRPPKGYENRRVIVQFKVTLAGQMEDLVLVSGTGNPEADGAALEAVRLSAPFQPLPEYTDEDVEIQFTFDYNVKRRI